MSHPMTNEDIEAEAEAEELLRDPYVQETIEEALAPYAGIAPEPVLQAMRAALEHEMTTNPYAVRIVKQLRPKQAPVKTQENEVRGGGDAGEGEAEAASSAGGREGVA